MSQDELYTIKEQTQTLIDLDRYAEAQSVIAKGLAIAPDNYDLLCMMSQVFITQKKWNDARLNAEQAIKAEPNLSWAYRLHSHALRGGGRRHDAIKSAKEAVKFEPYDSLNWYTLCLAQLQVFDLKEASIAAEKMRELSPDWYLSHQALALVASDKKNYKEAEEHLSRALELNPNSYESLNNMGVNLLNQKRKREAIEFFNLAAKLNPQRRPCQSEFRNCSIKVHSKNWFWFFRWVDCISDYTSYWKFVLSKFPHRAFIAFVFLQYYFCFLLAQSATFQ